MIVGLVMAVLMANVMDRVEWARVETTKLKTRSLEGALEMFQIENRHYPQTDPGLRAVVADERGEQSFVRDEDALEDAWARPFGYESPGQHRRSTYDPWSRGRDGESGGNGQDADITKSCSGLLGNTLFRPGDTAQEKNETVERHK